MVLLPFSWLLAFALLVLAAVARNIWRARRS